MLNCRYNIYTLLLIIYQLLNICATQPLSRPHTAIYLIILLDKYYKYAIMYPVVLDYCTLTNCGKYYVSPSKVGLFYMSVNEPMSFSLWAYALCMYRQSNE